MSSARVSLHALRGFNAEYAQGVFEGLKGDLAYLQAGGPLARFLGL